MELVPPKTILLALAGKREELLFTAMHRTSDIVLGTVGLVVAIVMVGWGIFHMLRKSDDPPKCFSSWPSRFPLSAAAFGSLLIFRSLGPFLIVFMAVVLWLHVDAAFGGNYFQSADKFV